MIFSSVFKQWKLVLSDFVSTVKAKKIKKIDSRYGWPFLYKMTSLHTSNIQHWAMTIRPLWTLMAMDWLNGYFNIFLVEWIHFQHDLLYHSSQILLVVEAGVLGENQQCLERKLANESKTWWGLDHTTSVWKGNW